MFSLSPSKRKSIFFKSSILKGLINKNGDYVDDKIQEFISVIKALADQPILTGKDGGNGLTADDEIDVVVEMGKVLIINLYFT